MQIMHSALKSTIAQIQTQAESELPGAKVHHRSRDKTTDERRFLSPPSDTASAGFAPDLLEVTLPVLKVTNAAHHVSWILTSGNLATLGERFAHGVLDPKFANGQVFHGSSPASLDCTKSSAGISEVMQFAIRAKEKVDHFADS